MSCGIIAPTWLDGASYVGQKTINGILCNGFATHSVSELIGVAGWMKQGGEKNYYYATADSAQKPCMYYEGYPKLIIGKNEWLYDTAAYEEQVQVFANLPHDVTSVGSERVHGPQRL